MNYRQFADHVKQQQRLKHRGMLNPEDDWYPAAYFEADGQVVRKDIPLWFFENSATKWMLVNELLVPFVRGAGVTKLGLAIVMFMLSSEHPAGRAMFEREQAGDPSPTAGMPRFQDIPGSVEHLTVHVFDAERHEAWFAEIGRPDSGAPTLAPFVLTEGPDSMEGDMIDPIKAALR